MASDEDYMSFLNKANQDTGMGGQASTTSSAPAKFKATDSGSNVPKPIKDVCANEVYTSDADEPFEAVSLKWNGDGGLPDEGTLAKGDNSAPNKTPFSLLEVYVRAYDMIQELTAHSQWSLRS